MTSVDASIPVAGTLGAVGQSHFGEPHISQTILLYALMVFFGSKHLPLMFVLKSSTKPKLQPPRLEPAANLGSKPKAMQ